MYVRMYVCIVCGELILAVGHRTISGYFRCTSAHLAVSSVNMSDSTGRKRSNREAAACSDSTPAEKRARVSSCMLLVTILSDCMYT